MGREKITKANSRSKRAHSRVGARQLKGRPGDESDSKDGGRYWDEKEGLVGGTVLMSFGSSGYVGGGKKPRLKQSLQGERTGRKKRIAKGGGK